MLSNKMHCVGTVKLITIRPHRAGRYSTTACVWKAARCARGNGAPSGKNRGKLTGPSLSSPGRGLQHVPAP